MDEITTRTDQIADEGVVDMGYHYRSYIPMKKADINGDGFATFIDFAILASQWLDEPGTPSADIVPYSGNGIVDMKDLAFLSRYWMWCFVNAAGTPSPGDNQAGVDPNVVLNWVPGEFATSHEVYFGTDFDGVNNADIFSDQYKGDYDVTSYDPCGLELGTYYYWRIDEVKDDCIVKGTVWRFKTIAVTDFKAINPNPPNFALGVDPNITLSWTSIYEVLSYDVYLGTDLDDVNDANIDSDAYMGNFDVNTYDPCGLEPGTVHFWRIDEENTTYGIVKGDVWGFKTIGMLDFKAINPEPTDGALDVDPNITLSWTTMYEVFSHDVYLGTDFDDVNDANIYSDAYMGNFDANSYDPCGLDFGTAYYWRIDEKNVLGTAKGAVWGFTTWHLNPVGWWQFEEGTGGTAYDSSGKGNGGTLIGEPNWVVGKVGDHALDFNGVGDYVDMADTVKNYLGTSYTVSAWIKANTITGVHAIAVYRRSVSDIGYQILFQLDYNNADVRFIVGSLGNNAVAYYPNALTTDTWYHVAGVREGNTLNVYVNAVSGASDSRTFGVISADNLKIGVLHCCGTPLTSYFDGTIDDVRIYDRVLSAGEILALYQAGLAP
ncbi:MAG: LamG-like jellyroll fold domain-containing protein [Planctomycetota bacterium]|jgi:hypothetical protein